MHVLLLSITSPYQFKDMSLCFKPDNSFDIANLGALIKYEIIYSQVVVELLNVF